MIGTSPRNSPRGIALDVQLAAESELQRALRIEPRLRRQVGHQRIRGGCCRRSGHRGRSSAGRPIRTSRPGSPRTTTLPTMARPLSAPIEPETLAVPSGSRRAVPGRRRPSGPAGRSRGAPALRSAPRRWRALPRQPRSPASRTAGTGPAPARARQGPRQAGPRSDKQGESTARHAGDPRAPLLPKWLSGPSP